MSEESIHKAYQGVLSLVRQKRLREAFDIVKAGLVESRCWDLQSSFDTIGTTYELMGQYMLQGVNDPQQQEMYSNIVIRLLEIADRIHLLLLDRESPKLYHILRNRMSRNNELPDLMYLIQQLQSAAMDISVGNLLPDKQKQSENSDKWYQLEKSLFEKIWTNTTWSNEDEEAANFVLESSPLTQTDLCLFIGAVTMSLLQCFDINKLLWLLKAYSEEKLSAKVHQRAIIGIFFVLHIYAERLKYYPKIGLQLSLLQEQPNFIRDLMECYINFFQCRETERITNIMNNEIVPDIIKGMNKMQPPTTDKNNDDEDKDIPQIIIPNIEDKEIQAKMERLTKMSMEGGDLYMSTFQNLKGFSFFHDIENWFKPFDLNQPCVLKLGEMGSHTNDTILTILKSTVYLCDNDKYSLVHLLPKMPFQQFDLMKEQLQQAEEMLNEHELSDEIIEKDEADSKLQNINYIHELYRFFKVSPRKKEFNDIFKIDILGEASMNINRMLCKSNELMLLAELLLKKKYWKEAAQVFEMIAQFEKGSDKNGSLFCHLGYAYQKQKQYDKALGAYAKAELFIPENNWLKEQKALCFRMMGQYDEALPYYKLLEQNNSENANVLFCIGICLGETGQYDDALQYFFKLSFIQPDSTKVWRAIGWYSLMCSKYEQAQSYYERLLATSSATAVDLLNAGHVEWLLQHLRQAYQYYRAAREQCQDKEQFITLFRNDIDMLIERGIRKNDISLMMDLV